MFLSLSLQHYLPIFISLLSPPPDHRKTPLSRHHWTITLKAIPIKSHVTFFLFLSKLVLPTAILKSHKSRITWVIKCQFVETSSGRFEAYKIMDSISSHFSHSYCVVQWFSAWLQAELHFTIPKWLPEKNKCVFLLFKVRNRKLLNPIQTKTPQWRLTF